jgi:hypothetical protein
MTFGNTLQFSEQNGSQHVRLSVHPDAPHIGQQLERLRVFSIIGGLGPAERPGASHQLIDSIRRGKGTRSE